MRNEINDICGQISNLIGDLSGMETQLNAESEAAAYRAAKIIQGEQRRIFAKANFKRDKKSHKYKFASGSHIGGIFGLCNIVYGDVTGLEVGVVNYDSSILGMQIGAVNWNSFASAGAQVGVYNKNVGKFTGLNLGGISFAEEIVGAQIGFINCVDNCTGLQLGVINACENMAGMQIGALNLIATSPVSAMVVANVMF